MIKIFFGDDRAKAQEQVRAILGDDYEIFEGGELDFAGFYSVLKGGSLFSEKRKILVRDLVENKGLWEKIAEIELKTEHDIIIWETKLDKRGATYKALAKKGEVEFREFKIQKDVDMDLVFGIFDTALRNGPEALKMLDRIEEKQDPFMFVGLLASQAIKRYGFRGGEKEKRVLKELSKLDMEIKSTQFSSQPWLLVRSFLLRVSSL